MMLWMCSLTELWRPWNGLSRLVVDRRRAVRLRVWIALVSLIRRVVAMTVWEGMAMVTKVSWWRIRLLMMLAVMMSMPLLPVVRP